MNFVSNPSLIEVKVKERIQVSAYLLKEAFNQVFSFLCVTCILFPEFLQIFKHILSQIPFLSLPFNICEFEAKFTAQLSKRPLPRSLHAEGIPLLKTSTIFKNNVAPTKKTLKRSTVNIKDVYMHMDRIHPSS